MPAARRRANDVPPKAPTPLAPLVGNMWMPVWAVRPGSYTALRGVALTMPLWLLLHSRNQDFFKPCYASREDLGMTLGIGRAKVSRQLGQLRKVGRSWPWASRSVCSWGLPSLDRCNSSSTASRMVIRWCTEASW